MEAELYADTPAPQGLNLNLASEDFLRNTAKWGKFLAIVGFVGVGFMVLAGIFAGTMLGAAMSQAGGDGFGSAGGGFFTVFYLIFAALYFFPVLYLYKFSDKMKAALDSKDEDLITESFKNLKSLFKFMGILTIVILGFYGLAIIFMSIGAGLGAMM
ncbi:hypothetical protein H7F15_01845 [Pontibacter sp. Tf4]|uniref:DUF5362 family protein n=1 Tax=Pontibacter sp. Tf4 TaxID=2761620 RepID=UPI001629BD1F|nr:DUF5362 family protein [Pontibacter sp. Tf4]MBB6609768.1 hypothetical protein [Pontibacter sp. Tf4]